MTDLEQELDSIVAAYEQGQISPEEYQYLLCEIRDVRAANELAGDEKAFRYIVMLTNVAIASLA